ncbi:ERC protein 2-like isoform X4 [Polyodon spathula]|uniref:ERC protein 2-like isoform X4 n=1 Tax=Polyodon spathula TaxID=7913 RepID=UPI001B7EB997|nr:ERC protein 2-like isoform X4 [Polyodon spathula]
MYGSARTVGHLEGSPSRSPRLPRSPRLGHRRTNSGGGGGAGGAGKTLSMENIQSLNAAYATSGPMYLSDHEGVATTTFPKGTMTLGRATSRVTYGGRVTAMGSSPNIASAGLPHADILSYSDHGTLTSAGLHHKVPSSLRQVRDNTMLDMHSQLKDLHRENELLRKELDLKDGKLGSSMNSIKTFWSPELKKERVLRKDEAARMSILKEQMRVSHEENQHLQVTIQALQDELRTQRDLNHLLQQESGSRIADHFTIELTEENFRRLQAEHDRQAKELFLLRKTLEEMELRIETQKQTLNARDESIKKLLEMLQSKGLPSRSMEDDNERIRRMGEAESQVNHLEVILDQKEKENIHLREELHRRTTVQQEPAKMKALQTVIEMKDTKIASLERNLRDLEDEVQMLKTNGLLNTEDREEEIKQMEVYKNHSKFMKNKIDQLKQDLSKKESELLALQTKLETLNNQNSDCKQHIEVLKESLTAKEQRSAILQTEVDALRLRLEEKESFLNKKTKQLQDLTEEKCTLAGEIRDMKDMLDVKERKINVLQKKIENLQEQLRDKDKQLTNLKDRVKSLQTDSSNTDTALATLEEALSEKERIIERLKEQRERDDRERLEETESYKKENKDLKEKVNALQAELTEKEAGLIDLKEHASSLASLGLKKDSKLKSLEIAIEQKKEECSKLEMQLKKAHEAEEVARINPEFAEKVKHLEKEVAYYKEESGKSQAEVDRLLEILKEVESEKSDTDKKIAELEGQVKDQNKKMANLKHNQEEEKKRSAQLLDEARKREDSLTDNSQQLQDSMRERSERVEELEKALRDSVHITAERERVLAQEESARSAAEKQLEELMMTLEKTRQELDSTKMRLSSTQQSLSEKDGHLTNLRLERRKQLEEILEMKQEALLAAISEKDANIALLELSSSKKKKTQEEVMALKREKDRLVHQLKQQTQNRMKLMADSYDGDHHHHHQPQQHPQHPQHHPPQHQHPQQHHPHPHPHPQHHPQHRSPARPPHANHRPSPDQMIQSLLEKHSHGMKLKLYIDHLTTLCLERDPQFLEGLSPLSTAEEEDDERLWEERAKSLTTEQLTEDLEKEELKNSHCRTALTACSSASQMCTLTSWSKSSRLWRKSVKERHGTIQHILCTSIWHALMGTCGEAHLVPCFATC